MNPTNRSTSIRIAITCLLLWLGGNHALVAQPLIDYQATLTANAGSGSLAPYYIASGRGGTVTQQYSALLSGQLWHTMDTTTRLSWGAGAELWMGYASSANYDRYDVNTHTFHTNSQHPARLWVQQAYIEGKYRGVFAVLGQKDIYSQLVNPQLSSGDLIMSGNARPAAGLRAGFVNFQNIPFTHGWVQITGEVGYYKAFDNSWLENHYNYYNHFITTGTWLHYKNIYFRTNPHQPFVFTIGAQAASQFAGTATYYQEGTITQITSMKADLKAFWRTMIAGSGGSSHGDNFVEGNHLGTWDIAAQYSLRSGHILRAYYQSPWEDGSGIGMMNGFDGLWGIEYRHPSKDSWLTGAVLEYVDLTNQSGPIHWAPGDHEGTPLTHQSTGADDYYNNYIYNGYQNRGMSIGSPFVRSTLYNLDGYMRYRDNLIRGLHAAIMGNLSPYISYRLMGSWRRAWGTPLIGRATAASATAMMLEATYCPPRQLPLRMTAQVAFDHGTLYGNQIGGLFSISYHGNFSLKR